MDAYILTVIASFIIWLCGIFSATQLCERKYCNTLMFVLSIMLLFAPLFINVLMAFWTPLLFTDKEDGPDNKSNK